jgi:hypothetical protein
MFLFFLVLLVSWWLFSAPASADQLRIYAWNNADERRLVTAFAEFGRAGSLNQTCSASGALRVRA